MDVDKTRAHWPNPARVSVEDAMTYYQAFPVAIDDQVALCQSSSAVGTQRLSFGDRAVRGPADVLRGE